LNSLKKGEEIALRMQQIDQVVLIYYLQTRVLYHLQKQAERDEAFRQLEACEKKRAMAIHQQLTDMREDQPINLESDLYYLSLLNTS
jgi:hypothetical protein